MAKSSAARPPASEDVKPNDIVILVMGCTRAGKSTFINLLLKHIGDSRPKLDVKPDVLTTVTAEMETVDISHQIERQNLHFLHIGERQRIVVVDTPGLPDRNQLAALKSLSDWLHASLKEATFGGIVYVHDISDDRDTGENARRNLSMLSGSFPEATQDRVVLVTTKWNILGPVKSKAREAELASGQWARLLRSAHLMRLYPDDEEGGPTSAWQVIRHALWRLDIRLGREAIEEASRLQSELERSNKHVPEEAEALKKALKEAVALQTVVFDFMKSAANGIEEAEESIRSKDERLQTLQRLVMLNKSLFYGRIIPKLTHKRIAYNCVVVG